MHEASGPDGTPDARVALRGSGRWIAAGTAMVAYAWWVVSLPPFSGLASAAVLLPGAAALVVGAARRRPERPHEARRPRIAAWSVLAGAICLWELLAYVQQPRSDHPTLSSLANALLASHPTRTLGFVIWLVVMAELARR